MIHQVLLQILRHFKIPERLVQTIHSFKTSREIAQSCDREEENPVRFLAGLPQGSPLSPILFLIYAVCLNHGASTQLKHITSYVDDDVMLQGGPTQLGRARMLHHRLDARVTQWALIGIRFALAKARLTHLEPISGSKKPDNTEGILLTGTRILHQDTFKSLEVIIDHRLTFNERASTAAFATRRSAGLLWCITKRKGSHQAHSITLPPRPPSHPCYGAQRSRGPEVAHLLTRRALAYNSIA